MIGYIQYLQSRAKYSLGCFINTYFILGGDTKEEAEAHRS